MSDETVFPITKFVIPPDRVPSVRLKVAIDLLRRRVPRTSPDVIAHIIETEILPYVLELERMLYRLGDTEGKV